MNGVVLRALGAILGLACIALAIPIGNLDLGDWPPWVVIVSFVGFGVAMLFYAATGRSAVFRRADGDKDGH